MRHRGNGRLDAVAWRAPVKEDDRVLVLGATGTVGLVAVQAAKLLGAKHVVAVGRNPSVWSVPPSSARMPP